MGWSDDFESKYQGTPIHELSAEAVGCWPQKPPSRAALGYSDEMIAYTQAQRKRGCPCCGHHQLSKVSGRLIIHDILVCLGCGVAFYLEPEPEGEEE